MYSDHACPDVEVLLQRPAWQTQAACRGMGTSIFFPERDDNGDISLDPAREVCGRCEVVSECLDYALEAESRDCRDSGPGRLSGTGGGGWWRESGSQRALGSFLLKSSNQGPWWELSAAPFGLSPSRVHDPP
jgi:hypothetical protein